MINDRNISGDLWKSFDYSTVSEIIQKDETSRIQATVDKFANQSKREKFELNESKSESIFQNLIRTLIQSF